MKQNPFEKAPTKKNWLYIISPCVIAAAFSVFAIIDSYFDMNSSGGWSFLGVLIFVPLLLLVIGIDLIVKLIFKKQIFYIWLIETLLIVIIIFFYKYYFMI